MELINLTPHALNIHAGGKVVTLPPSGEIARVSVEYVETGTVAGIPVFSAKYGEVIGLPLPREGFAFVTSGMVQSVVPNRRDVFSPGELVRNEEGQPIGCKGLKQ